MAFEAIPIKTSKNNKPQFDTLEYLAKRITEVVSEGRYLGHMAVKYREDSDHPMEMGRVDVEGVIVFVDRES